MFQRTGVWPPQRSLEAVRVALAITAPYFHDGSEGSLEQLLEENGDRMGHSSALSSDQRQALEAYLRSL